MNNAKTVHPSEGVQKTPAVSGWFWALKLLSTGMGEAASDWLVHRLGTYPAVGLGAVVFCIGMAVQLRSRRYETITYWTTVCLVAVFGTMIADAVHVGLGVPYAVSTVGGLIAVVVAMMTWKYVEGTVSLSSVTRGRVELFYWAAVIATFALGTAAGDWTSRTLGLGYLGSTVLFVVLFSLTVVWFGVTKSCGVASFWIAYIITRPLGASFADYLGMDKSRSGLGLGLGNISLFWLACIGLLLVVARRYDRKAS